MGNGRMWFGFLILMTLAAFGHGRQPRRIHRPRLVDQQQTNIAPAGDFPFAKSIRDRKNDFENPKKSRILARQVSSPSSLSSPESEPPSVHPEAEKEAEAETEAESWPEAGPEWSIAFKEWGGAWEFHVYFFALVFLGYALYSAFFIVTGLYTGLNQKYLGFSLNVMMFILGFTRMFVLFTDPYHQGDLIHNAVAMRVLWSLGSPCLTSADSLVILVLIETAKISLAPQKMQTFGTIIKIIIAHFILVLTSDFVVSEFMEAKAMLLLCQIVYIVWGSVLGIGYCILGYKLGKKLYGHTEVKDKRALLYIRLIYASGVNNLILSVMYIYSSAGVFGVYSNVKYIEAWSWWSVQTCYRLSEVLSGILVFTVSAKRKSIKRQINHSLEGDGLDDDTAQPVFTQRMNYEISNALRNIVYMRFLTMEEDRQTTMLEDLQESKRAAAMYITRAEMNAQTYTQTQAPDAQKKAESMLEYLHDASLEANDAIVRA
ncbi:uncharacterized protein LOC111330555 [Stylophora pistillata]|uniref:uncharacterized protein LOC111330555 n=1 Tax=Stylophora pistillata TaxID=50429 RepID=UPI000C048485|nr:uncharacterized protein LOC111330555 [Stylophora pistillata]